MVQRHHVQQQQQTTYLPSELLAPTDPSRVQSEKVNRYEMNIFSNEFFFLSERSGCIASCSYFED